jgi:DMSO/TMAO reductase YedYZ molybdopterin-dependent catalytic subunit
MTMTDRRWPSVSGFATPVRCRPPLQLQHRLQVLIPQLEELRFMLIGHLRLAKHAAICGSLLFASTLALSDEVLLEVGGKVDTPLELTRADLAEMPRACIEVPTREDRNVMEVWEGVPMIEILRKAGAPVDERIHGHLAGYVLVTAEDGYKAVYALAEIDPAYALDRQVVVADTLDGKPLSGKFGDLRLVNKGEGRFSRWVRQVEALEVRVAE